MESITETEIASEHFINPGTRSHGEITEFSVVESWKGSHAKQIYTAIVTQCCLCGMRFAKGSRHLLYVYGPNKNGFYGTSICTRTKPIERAVEDIDVLNRIKAGDTGIAPPAK